ncbi:MAG: inositol monophosphatase [Rhodospirillales bacterium]|nr:inositol monophosphatase [Rhodospirillales bacterium]
MSALARRLDAAIALGEEAGRLALRLRPPPGAPVASLKGAQDWLTEADGAVESALAEALAAQFPTDGFQGEETGHGRDGRLRWVVDPIDGTSNYARGSGRFCVSIGLIEDRQPLLGVLVAPALGEVFAARQGHGATLNGAPIRAAETTDLSRAAVECGWSPRRPNTAFFALAQGVMGSGAMLRAGGSGALGLADVAAGRIDAYAELHINLWDVAAALAILAEAGAVVSDFMAGDGPVRGNPILAAAPGVAAALTAITGIGG